MGAYLVAMLAIGLFSFGKNEEYEDYMLGGRGLHPFVAAMSAGASDMSGWLLLGLPGALYMSGFSEMWMAIGLLVGAAVNWKITAPRLRSYTEMANNSITVPSFFENRFQDRTRILRVAASLVILVFFTFYVASGMVAGGKYFQSTFESGYMTGIIIISGVTVIYTFIGGFLAVSLTDTVQGVIMFISLLLVPVMALITMDDPGAIFSYQLNNAYGLSTIAPNPHWFSLFTGVSFITIISNLAWGLGYFGQPHIIVRFMALRTPADATVARRIGVGWMAISALGAVATAIVGISYFSQHADMEPADAETVFLDLAQILFHPFIAGLVLAAVLAAIMSTISSQLVVTSSALIEDLFKIVALSTGSTRTLQDKTYVLLGRLGVLVVAVIAVVLAISPSNSILDLVAFAWAGFGASFGPIVLLTLFWKRLSNWGALFGLLSGAVVAFVWGQVSTPMTDSIYEIIPGFIVNLIVAVVVSRFTYKHDEASDIEFEESVELSRVK